MDMQNAARAAARGLLEISAVYLRPDEPFTWASGIKSPIYCDNRLTLTAPAVRTVIEEGLCGLLRTHYPDCEVLMGTSTAGIPHAAICGHLLGLPMGYVRSSAKDHGRANRIEGKLEPGQKVVVESDTKKMLKIVSFVYLIPVILFLAGYLIMLACSTSVAVQYTAAVAGAVLGILLAIWYDRRVKARGGLSFTIVRVF